MFFIGDMMFNQAVMPYFCFLIVGLSVLIVIFAGYFVFLLNY